MTTSDPADRATWKPLGEPSFFPPAVAEAMDAFARRITEAKERRIRNALAGYTFPIAMIIDCPGGHIPVVPADDDGGREWHLFPLVRVEYPDGSVQPRDTWLRVSEAATADEVAQSLDTVRALLAHADGDA